MQYKIEVFNDPYPNNPREDDNLGVMMCKQNTRYNLGDEQDIINFNEFNSMEEVKEKLIELDYIIMPLYLYDHSGICIRTKPFNNSFDSGQVGFIGVQKEKVINEFGSSYNDEDVKMLLDGEVKEYNQYLAGDIWAVKILSYETCKECGHIKEEETEDYSTGFLSEEEARESGEELIKQYN